MERGLPAVPSLGGSQRSKSEGGTAAVWDRRSRACLRAGTPCRRWATRRHPNRLLRLSGYPRRPLPAPALRGPRPPAGLLWPRPVVPPLVPPKGLFTPVYWDPAANCNVFNDKPWLTVDNSGGPHDGRVYVTWSRFRFAASRYQESVILMTFSDDNGLSWSDPREVNGSS